MVYKSGQIFLPFCHNPRVWRTDRQRDGQTEFSSLDRVCIACSAVKKMNTRMICMIRVSYFREPMLYSRQNDVISGMNLRVHSSCTVCAASVPLLVSWVSVHLKIQIRVLWHLQSLVYLVTCNWSSLSVNLFNTAVAIHQKPIFLLQIRQNCLAASSARTHCGSSPDPLAGFRR